MPPMLAALLSSLCLAGPGRGLHPVLGGAWRPAGRADLAWVEDGQLSGSLAARGDGFVEPPLTLYLGVGGPRLDLLGELGLLYLGTRSVLRDEEGEAQSRSGSFQMGLRLGADLRWRARPPTSERAEVRPYAQVGVNGVLPAARKADTSWTVEEQQAQDEAAAAERARIGSVGARAGGGAMLCAPVGACAGLRGLVGASRSAARGETGTSAALLIAIEPALTFELTF